jgi:NAD(P)-dependent dehydrogenase (short-subunit alcohol dehydrogenase family)
MFDLGGRVALVTGATGGLGTAIVDTFAAQGATLVVADLDPDRCVAAAARLRAQGNEAHGIGADLADVRSIDALVETTLQRYGRVDVVVCNAGVQGPSGSLLDATDVDWERVMDINVRGVLRLLRPLVPGMAARGDGSVILMSSIAGLRGNRAIGLYGMSKAALAQLARNLAVEWGPGGVRVNAVSPGLVRTPLSQALITDAEFMRRRLQATPLRRVGEPEEVAGVVAMLAGRAGGFITGQNIVVDGGTTISDGS